MDANLFAYIWDVSVSKTVGIVFDSIPDDVRRKYKMRTNLSDAWREHAFGKYSFHNKKMHDDFFKGSLIDVHKILACLVAALLDVDLISYDTTMRENDGRLHICAARAKYEIAMHSALHFLYLFMQWDFSREGDTAAKEALARQGCLKFPNTKWEHGEWLRNRISALALNHINGNKIDILAYADMMFWIEFYNGGLARSEGEK